MAAATTSSEIEDDDSAASRALFAGMKFCVLQRVPQRSFFITALTQNGAQIVPLEKNAHIVIADHIRRDAPSGSVSYRWITESIHEKTLADVDEHRAGPAPTSQAAAAPGTNSKTTRAPYTPEEDLLLYRWVQKAISNNLHISGNALYQKLAQHHSRHTFQSWRDHYLKVLKVKPPLNWDDPTYCVDADPSAYGFEELLQGSQARSATQRLEESSTRIEPPAQIEEPQAQRSAHSEEASAESEEPSEESSEHSEGSEFFMDGSVQTIYLNREFDQLYKQAPKIETLSSDTYRKAFHNLAITNDDHSIEEWKQLYEQYVRPAYLRTVSNEASQSQPSRKRGPEEDPVMRESTNGSNSSGHVERSAYKRQRYERESASVQGVAAQQSQTSSSLMSQSSTHENKENDSSPTQTSGARVLPGLDDAVQPITPHHARDPKDSLSFKHPPGSTPAEARLARENLAEPSSPLPQGKELNEQEDEEDDDEQHSIDFEAEEAFHTPAASQEESYVDLGRDAAPVAVTLTETVFETAQEGQSERVQISRTRASFMEQIEDSQSTGATTQDGHVSYPDLPDVQEDSSYVLVRPEDAILSDQEREDPDPQGDGETVVVNIDDLDEVAEEENDTPPSEKPARSKTGSEHQAEVNESKALEKDGDVSEDEDDYRLFVDASEDTYEVVEAPAQGQDVSSRFDNFAEYYDSLLARGHQERRVLAALHATTLDSDLTEYYIHLLEKGQDIPQKLAGIWTPEDDNGLIAGRPEVIRKLTAKHGAERLRDRREFLELWANS